MNKFKQIVAAGVFVLGTGSFAYAQSDHGLTYYEKLQAVCHQRVKLVDAFIEARELGTTEAEVLEMLPRIDEQPGLRRALNKVFTYPSIEHRVAFLSMSRIDCFNAYLGQ